MDTHGTFTRDGVTKVAYSQREAVQLEFNGWTRVPDAPAGEEDAPAQAEPSDAPPADTADVAPDDSAGIAEPHDELA